MAPRKTTVEVSVDEVEGLPVLIVLEGPVKKFPQKRRHAIPKELYVRYVAAKGLWENIQQEMREAVGMEVDDETERKV